MVRGHFSGGGGNEGDNDGGSDENGDNDGGGSGVSSGRGVIWWG